MITILEVAVVAVKLALIIPLTEGPSIGPSIQPVLSSFIPFGLLTTTPLASHLHLIHELKVTK